jgi:hypothetical protein
MQPTICEIQYPLSLIQELKRQLEASGVACGVRASLLATIAAVSGALSPPGLEADMRPVLALVLLAGRLDDGEPALRCAAAELLIGERRTVLFVFLAYLPICQVIIRRLACQLACDMA